MILFRKRTIRLVPFYLLYMAAVLAASSLYELYAAESGEIVAQVFGDRVYCYLLVPPFIWTISTIDGSTKKPSFIRMKSRNQYLLFLLLQQYLFAVIYLTTWFSMIYILAIWHGERYLFVDMFSSYIRYLLSFFLLANISEMLKRTKNKMLAMDWTFRQSPHKKSPLQKGSGHKTKNLLFSKQAFIKNTQRTRLVEISGIEPLTS